MIEKGHHFHAKFPPEQRLCKLYSLSKVEEEFHFMLKCTFYVITRSSIQDDDTYMFDKEHFILLMGCTENGNILPWGREKT